MTDVISNAKEKLQEITDQFNGDESHDNRVAYAYDDDLTKIGSDLTQLRRSKLPVNPEELTNAQRNFELVSRMRYKVKIQIVQDQLDAIDGDGGVEGESSELKRKRLGEDVDGSNAGSMSAGVNKRRADE